MKTIIRRLTIGTIAAVGLTAASMTISYEFCMCGQGRGLPFAVVHPSHDERELAIALYDKSKEKWGQELDILRTGGNLLFWGAIAMCIFRRKSKSNKEEEEESTELPTRPVER